MEIFSGEPSPKFHDQLAIIPLETIEESWKDIAWFKHTLAKPNLANGEGYMVTCIESI